MAGLDLESGKESIKTREELIEECLDLGIPVTGHEDEETLEMFLGSADDDDFVDDEEEDDFDDDFEDDELDEPVDDKEILDEEFDFEEDDDDDLFDDDDPQYN